MADCALHIALAGVTASAWLGLGTVVLGRLDVAGDRALTLLNRFAAGAVVFALATFALGLAGALYAAVLVPATAFAALLGVRTLLRERLRWPDPRGWPRWQAALAALVAVYVVAELAITCAPVSSADALLHHAAAPELYAQVHAFRELPWSWNSYQPYTVEMLVTDGILLRDVEQGAFAALLLGLGGLAATAGLGHRLLGRGGAVLAAAAYWAQPFTAWISTSLFVEPATAFFVALAAWNLLAFVRADSERALVLAGLACGAAAGTKYVGPGTAFVLGGTAALALRARLSPRRLALAVLPALAVASPWYVKNAILTGDPLYPLLRGWPNDEARAAAVASLGSYGHGTSVADLAALPLRLLGDAAAFDRGEFLSPLLLLFAPVALLAPVGRRASAYALAGCATVVLVWFFGVQHARFLLPLFPVLAVLAAHGTLALARDRVGRLVAATAYAGALGAGLAITALYASQLLPVVVGLEPRERFLRENTPYYEGLVWLNERLPPDAVVALDHVLVLHSEPRAVGWTSDALPTTAGAAETRAFVRRYGITHAQVFAASSARRRQLELLGARPIGRVTARTVGSRTLGELGPPEPMLVYELPRRR